MSKELTIEEVIESLKTEYDRAKKKSFIAKPMAYALHSVWKAVDLTEKRRKLPHKEDSNAGRNDI